ncbi:hypothetical protein A3F38_00975 [Candidatus Saccharibacteria bacterium RIFCSPHIGHO2_12_FULL_48_21]|nr:MAG: hypothetical protein A3F38_00975 [Candidatus Saccharibacteria bacterium RIFCSPHIGHO2_12_FULL_48_21]
MFGVIGITLAVSFALTFDSTNAQAAESWISSDLALSKDGDLPQGLVVPYSMSGNRDCANHEFVTRPAKLFQSEIKHTACAVQTPIGMVDGNGWLELNNTDTAGKLKNHIGYQSGIIAIPNSTTVINTTSAAPGLYLHFTKHLQTTFDTAVAPTGEITYQVTGPADGSLRDKSGTLLRTHTDSLSFSASGGWLVVDARYRAMLRVNTNTLEVLPFAPTFNYDIGLGPVPQTAITSSGRYAVVYSRNFSVFKIYDLNTCGPVPNSINAPVSCQSRNLLPLVQQSIPGLQSIARIRFVSDDILSFYANYQSIPGDPTSARVGKFRISTSGAMSNSRLELLALGDSYISGEGTFEYKTGTDINDNRCHLSVLSYPFLMSKDINLNSFNSIACSGAKIMDITDISDYYNQERSQSDGKPDQIFDNEIYDNFLPGYRAQLNFVSTYLPENVLLSVGGNDIGFSKILRRCLEPDTCYSTYEDRVELVREINGRFPKLVETYTKIAHEGTPEAKLFVIGYPQIVLPGGSCDLNVLMNAQELEFARLITAYLNDVIAKAAGKAGAIYVDTQNALNGHRLCEAVDKDVAVHGLTAGDNTPSFLNGPIGNESYHPNQLGHRLLSQSILYSTQNLSKNMPPADANSNPPSETGLEILNSPKANRPVNQTSYDDDLANDIVYREQWWDLTIQGLKYSLNPLIQLRLVLNSEPVNLGTPTTSAYGDLSTQVMIPASVPAGFHTLHVYGTNRAGEPVDIYKTIYVAANEGDFDDDRLPNSTDSCDTVRNSGVDYDQDGVDDACDGFIGSPPANPQISDSIGPSSENQISFTRGSLPTDPLDQPEITIQPAAVPSSADTDGVVLAKLTTPPDGKGNDLSSVVIDKGLFSPSKVYVAMVVLTSGITVYFFRKLFKGMRYTH